MFPIFYTSRHFSVSRQPFGIGVFVLFCPEPQRTTARRATRPQGTLTSVFMAAGIFLFVGPLIAGRFHVELGEVRQMSRVLWWTTKSLCPLEMTAYECQTGSRPTPFVMMMVGKCESVCGYSVVCAFALCAYGPRVSFPGVSAVPAG